MSMPAKLDPAVSDPSRPIEIVAALLTHRGRLGLFRRSRQVTGDVGRWHCITGFLPQGAVPLHHVLIEVLEELGLEEHSLRAIGDKVIEMEDGSGQRWRVHTFHFESETDCIQLNWENDGACWVAPDELHTLSIVHWLPRLVGELSTSHYPNRIQ